MPEGDLRPVSLYNSPALCVGTGDGQKEDNGEKKVNSFQE